MLKKIILSGMRPTGKLHIGNALGALSNWISLQDEPGTLCYYMVADWHALTTDYKDPSATEKNIEDMVLDWIAQGLDPEKSIIFRQSWISEHADLALILSMITPLAWLFRNPSYKEQMSELKEKEIATHGFLGYPVLQAADILLYRATHVPVGEDQLPHLELTREIARRFNHIYGKNILLEPAAILSPSPRVAGLDGRKMSKSYENCIYISENESAIKKKINSMFTDPTRIKATDRGHPDPCPENPTGCAVFATHKLYTSQAPTLNARANACREGQLSCSQCKNELFLSVNNALAPMREKRESLAAKKGRVSEVLRAGTQKAKVMANSTYGSVRDALHFAV